ncbi:MAG: hypothetical protein L3K26_08145 [Candidatus Hydrogenedentes bacterium]|nr:hypothetical protein [Candidatus Hydrogenedentota bacterium]
MGCLRLPVALGSIFFGFSYLVVAVVFLFSGRIENRPTTLSVESAEKDGFPERAYLRVTGGYVVLSEAEIALKFDKSELLYITAPVVSESLWEAWKVSTEKGETLDAGPVRLFVAFDTKQAALLWPEAKKRALAGDPLGLPTVKMDVVGETQRAEDTVFKPNDFKGPTTNLDWEPVRVLKFKRHFNSLGTVAKNFGIALGLFVLAGAALFYSGPKWKVKVGDSYTFTGDEPPKERIEVGDTHVFTDDGDGD